MNRHRLHRVSQGMPDERWGAVSNGMPGRPLFQEAGGRRRRVPIRLARPWGIVLAIAGPILAGLFTGLAYRSLRRK